MEPFIGQISTVAFPFAPRGWALCNGQLLSIAQNQALFSILGTTYGGNGVQTFALPDLRGRAAMNASSANPLGTVGGTETVALLSAQMPAHTHSVNAVTTAPTVPSPSNALWAAAASGNQYAATTNASMSPSAMGGTGGSQPHGNMQPSTVLNFVIALQGIFPSRN